MKTTTKTHAPGFRLRWKRNKRERWGHPGGESHTLTDANGTRFAMVQHHRTGGWFWVAGWEGREHGVQPRNTAGEAPLEEAEAKAAALTYVKAALAKAVGP